jgi:hypothetical protein
MKGSKEATMAVQSVGSMQTATEHLQSPFDAPNSTPIEHEHDFLLVEESLPKANRLQN